MTKPAYGAAWQRFRLQVFRTYGRACLVHLDGCTGYATTVDHLDPVALHGDELPSIDRARPACLHCNSSLGARLRDELHQLRTEQPSPIPSRDW